ncbi:MAG: response regulator [Armatimonadetes bacterium]|nr:response regulator [Armatimonadota bacterium]
MRLMEKQGHQVAVANTGREAVEAALAAHFDIILMDVQMPEMNGFQATAEIRAREVDRHVPIVAMTAHAMKGDRERCLEAGMDGYVSKPIQPQVLYEEIDRLLSEFPATEEPSSGELVAAPPPAGVPMIDLDDVMERFDGDEQLICELVDLFLGDLPYRMTEVRDAVSTRDAAALQRAAHTIKGAIGIFSAPTAYAAALVLERAGKDEELADASAALGVLEREIEQLVPALRILQKPAAPAAG